MSKYIDSEKLIAELTIMQFDLNAAYRHPQSDSIVRAISLEYDDILSLVDSLQQEQPELYKKDESLGSPDYERGFKHGRDYQTEVTRKYTDKDKVVAYLVDKGYPISTTGEIPTYQETFDMISNAIKYTDQQEPPDTGGLYLELADFLIRNDIQEDKAKFLANRIADKYGSKRYIDGLCDGLDVNEQEQPTLPDNLDEAAEDFVWEVMENDEEGISELSKKLRPTSKISDYYDALGEFFKTGAKWMAEQGVQDSIEGTICGRVYDHVNVKFPDGIGKTLEPKGVSHIPANVKNYNIGDKVLVQIRKKEEK